MGTDTVDKVKGYLEARECIEDAIACVQEGWWLQAAQALVTACEASPGDCRMTQAQMTRAVAAFEVDESNERWQIEVLGLLECWTLSDGRCYRLQPDGRVKVFTTTKPNPLASLLAGGEERT
jgi:hypothetical protein